MATVISSRALCRTAIRARQISTSTTTAIRPLARFNVSSHQAFRHSQSLRSYATQPNQSSTPPPPDPPKSEPPSPASNPGGIPSSLIILLGLAGIGAGTYLAYSQGVFGNLSTKAAAAADATKLGGGAGFTPAFGDYQKVYDAIAKRLQDEDEYDDGSYGPVLLRLAWHCSGTYDKETGTGGSNGSTMRFAPERDHGANGGLGAAREFLEPIKEQFPWITYSDLWTLAGVAAIQEMQGPIVPWRPGRSDRDISYCTPDGRLPDGAKGQDHVRAIFYRMGFNDQEIVALAGAHALGRCHTDRSGFTGPWTFSPTVLTNDYFRLLSEEKWQWKKWNGPAQYEDVKTKSLMMLPADMALVKDKEFKKTVDVYARDNDKFFGDFSAVIVKLLELGVPFGAGQEDRFRFKPSE